MTCSVLFRFSLFCAACSLLPYFGRFVFLFLFSFIFLSFVLRSVLALVLLRPFLHTLSPVLPCAGSSLPLSCLPLLPIPTLCLGVPNLANLAWPCASFLLPLLVLLFSFPSPLGSIFLFFFLIPLTSSSLDPHLHLHFSPSPSTLRRIVLQSPTLFSFPFSSHVRCLFFLSLCQDIPSPKTPWISHKSQQRSIAHPSCESICATKHRANSID